MGFQRYKRKGFAEARPVTQEEISKGKHFLKIRGISVSAADAENGSPKKGDMIARNPKDHYDQWLIAKKYFEDNFEV